MPDNLNLNAVWQSIADTWLPAVVIAGVIVVGIAAYGIIRRKRNK